MECVMLDGVPDRGGQHAAGRVFRVLPKPTGVLKPPDVLRTSCVD